MVAGLGAVLGVGLFRAARGGGLPVAVAALAAAAAVAGVLARDRALSRQVAAVRRRLLAQLPAIAELVVLAVAAGEAVRCDRPRVHPLGNGDLARQLRR